MLGWLGWKEGLPLWRSYRLNKGLKHDVETIFEGIADTRKQLLTSWTEEYWGHMARLRDQLLSVTEEPAKAAESAKALRTGIKEQFTSAYTRASDFTELFILSTEGTVVLSTYPNHEGERYGTEGLFVGGIDYANGQHDRKCLFGPFADAMTLRIGPRTSSFHDEMTLLFIEPLYVSGEWKGTLCGRVPNDVIGDLIQRESGHVYPDSGDNYIFMAKPVLNKQIEPGTALSRSRFEDRTFTHGENLKDGVTTAWGIVKVKEHTELELMFTDPATGELHPGVAGTIRSGSNLFVEFPGYSDYRHIPVIGKGVTFRLPHCPDVWGMMCEGDLEEVYRIRSIAWRQFRLQSSLFAAISILSALLVYLVSAHLSPLAMAFAVGGFNLLLGLAAVGVFHQKSSKKLVGHLHNINRFIRINAEGKGDLTQRLKPEQFDNDETKELAKWINNMIDSLEGIMLQVKLASGDVQISQQSLDESTETSVVSTERMGQKIHHMIRSIRRQLKDIDEAKDVAGDMRVTLRTLEEQASEQIAVALGEVERIGDKMDQIAARVAETNGTIRNFMATTEEIRSVLQVIEEISAQTNLLALNASIEAARVGEHGRGFAVVATEIRKLADMTRKSTDEVHEIVAAIHENAKQAQDSMEEGTRVVGEGTELVAAASQLLSTAKAEETRKTQVVDEVVKLMEKIAAVSIENRSVSGEVESNMQELIGDIVRVRHTSHHVEAITSLLQQLVGQFQLTEARKR